MICFYFPWEAIPGQPSPAELGAPRGPWDRPIPAGRPPVPSMFVCPVPAGDRGLFLQNLLAENSTARRGRELCEEPRFAVARAELQDQPAREALAPQTAAGVKTSRPTPRHVTPKVNLAMGIPERTDRLPWRRRHGLGE